MDQKSAIDQSPPNSLGGEKAVPQQTPDVNEVTPLQSGCNGPDSRCRPEKIETERISLQGESVKSEKTPQILPGRKLTKVRTLPNIPKCLLFPTDSLNNISLSSRPSTEPAFLYNPSVEDVKGKFCTTSRSFNTDNIPSKPADLANCGDHQNNDETQEKLTTVSVQENPTSDPEQDNPSSVDQCLQGILQTVSGSFPNVVSDHTHISSDSASNILKKDATTGTFYSRILPVDKQNKHSTADTDSEKKKISITEKKIKTLPKKTKKSKSRDSSKDSLSVDEASERKPVALRKSKKRLSFKIPIADEGIPKSLSSAHDKKEMNRSNKRILKNNGTRERSPRKFHSPKEIPSKSSFPTCRFAKKCLTDKQSSSNRLSRKTTGANGSLKDISSRDQSVENRLTKATASKNNSLSSRGHSTNKTHSNRSIKNNRIRVAKSQPQTNVTSKTQKNTLTHGSLSKRTFSNKSMKDNDIHGGSVSSVSSTERVFKKQTSSGKRQQSKQRSLKQPSKGTLKDQTSNLPHAEDTCNKGSLLIRNRINPSKAMENRDKVSEISDENRTLSENSRDRVSSEHKTLSKAASQPIKKFDSSNSSRNAEPKVVSEIHHYRSETLKCSTRVTDGKQLRAEKSTSNRPVKEDKLKTQNAVNNSTIDAVTLKQSFRELGTQSKRQNLSTLSSQGDTSEGSQNTGRHEPKSHRAIASDRLIESPTFGRSFTSRSRKIHTTLKFPSKDKGNIDDSSSSEPQSSIKRRNVISSKEIPVAGNSSTEVPQKTQRNIKSSSKVPSRSNAHSSIEDTTKTKVIANTETKMKEIPSADSSEDMVNKCLLSVCRPSTDVKSKNRPVWRTGLPMKQSNRKLSSKENLEKVEVSGEKLKKIFSTADKEAKDYAVNEKSEDESIRKHDSKDRTAKGHLKSTTGTEQKQKTAISGKPDGRKSLSEQSTNKKMRKKKPRKQKRLRSRFSKQHRIATCCGGRNQTLSAKIHKCPPTRLSIGNNKSKADQTPSVKMNKEILTLHPSKKARSHSRHTESSLERKLSSRSEISSSESDSDYESSDSSGTNVTIIRDRRDEHPHIPRGRRKHIVSNTKNPDPMLYRKSSIKLVPVHGYNFGIMYPVDVNAPAPARRSIGSSIAKESRRARAVSHLEEKPVLFYETVGENFYQSPRSQSIVGHDLIAPQAPPRRVPLYARERCLVHERPSGRTKCNVRVRSPLPCICRRPQRVLTREVPEKFNPSAMTRTENYAIGYQFRDIPIDVTRRRSQDHVKEFLYDLGKSILPPDRYRGKLLTNDVSTPYNFRSRMSDTNQGSAKSIPNKDIR